MVFECKISSKLVRTFLGLRYFIFLFVDTFCRYLFHLLLSLSSSFAGLAFSNPNMQIWVNSFGLPENLHPLYNETKTLVWIQFFACHALSFLLVFSTHIYSFLFSRALRIFGLLSRYERKSSPRIPRYRRFRGRMLCQGKKQLLRGM